MDYALCIQRASQLLRLLNIPGLHVGFFLFGFGGIWLVVLSKNIWALGARWMHMCFGVLSIIAQKLIMKNKRIAVDLVAGIVATIIPLMMLVVTEHAGLIQRLMFLVAYNWYIYSALIDLNKSVTE